MPELPEVESLRQKIKPQLSGSCIQRVLLRRKDLRYPLPLNLEKKIKGQRITNVSRRAKYLLIEFENDLILAVHLGMSGRFFFADPNLVFDKHDHVIVELQDGRQLRFRDPRRFGMMFLLKKENWQQDKFFRHLGVEPLSKDFSPENFYRLCQKSQTTIKSLLMNAERVVGVGNIYACEALFLSGVRPTRKTQRISKKEAEIICQNVKKVLTDSIAVGGTTFRDYVDANENPGLYVVNLNVYAKEAEPCVRCQTPIKRIAQTGRSSFYCSQCQK